MREAGRPSHFPQATIRTDCHPLHSARIWRPASACSAMLLGYVGCLAGIMLTDHLLISVALTTIACCIGCQLFVIAHDACHGSYTNARLANDILGRLAFLPSLHNFSLWRYQHNYLHHSFANLRGMDFVWVPLSPHEYDALPRWRRFLERIYRHPSGGGFAAYYIIELWSKRLFLARGGSVDARMRHHRLDAAAVGAYAMVLTAASFISSQNDGAFDEVAFATKLACALAVPFLMICWAIGFVVFFNHTHPRVRWFDSAMAWQCASAPLRDSVNVRFTGIWKIIMPTKIMFHAVHHVDPLIPVGSLEHAVPLIAKNWDCRSWRWTPRRHAAIIRYCGLFDYRSGRWTQIHRKPSAALRRGTV
jgi:acyl-lipid omega-6 desaturase (Delta-12 desaturase)